MKRYIRIPDRYQGNYGELYCNKKINMNHLNSNNTIMRQFCTNISYNNLKYINRIVIFYVLT